MLRSLNAWRTVRLFRWVGSPFIKAIAKMTCQGSLFIHVLFLVPRQDNCSRRRLICELREIERLLSLPLQAYSICHIDLRSLPFLVSKHACVRMHAIIFRINNYIGNVCLFSNSSWKYETRVIERENVERCDGRCWEGNTSNAEETEHGRFCLVGEGKRSIPISTSR